MEIDKVKIDNKIEEMYKACDTLGTAKEFDKGYFQCLVDIKSGKYNSDSQKELNQNLLKRIVILENKVDDLSHRFVIHKSDIEAHKE